MRRLKNRFISIWPRELVFHPLIHLPNLKSSSGSFNLVLPFSLTPFQPLQLEFFLPQRHQVAFWKLLEFP